MTTQEINNLFPRGYNGGASISDLKVVLSKVITTSDLNGVNYYEVPSILGRDAIVGQGQGDLCKVIDTGAGNTSIYVWANNIWNVIYSSDVTAALDTRVVTLETGSAALDTRVVTLETGSAALDTRVVTLETGSAALDTRVVALETGSAALDTRVVALETGATLGGTTAARPIDPVLFTKYWDTTLNKLITCTTNTTGANIWMDALGTAV